MRTKRRKSYVRNAARKHEEQISFYNSISEKHNALKLIHFYFCQQNNVPQMDLENMQNSCQETFHHSETNIRNDPPRKLWIWNHWSALGSKHIFSDQRSMKKGV